MLFGVKLTNTFPVKIGNNELPGREMYMSGRALYPLTINLAYKLAKEFDGDLRISYSGGADFFNLGKIYETGIWPITLATTLLKPGGYLRLGQMADSLAEGPGRPAPGADRSGETASAVRKRGRGPAASEEGREGRGHQVGATGAPDGLLHRAVPGWLSDRAGCPGIPAPGGRGKIPGSARGHRRQESAAIHHRDALQSPVYDGMHAVAL